MQSFILDNISLIVVILFVLMVLIVALLFLNITQTNNLREKYEFFMKGKTGQSIEAVHGRGGPGRA